MKKIGFDVEILVLIPKLSLLNVFQNNNIKVYKPIFSKDYNNKVIKKFLNFINIIFSFFRVLILLIKNKDTIVHFFLPTSYIVGGLAGWILGHKRMIMSRRSLKNYQERQNFVLNFIEKKLHKKMRFICGNSLAVISQLASIDKIDKDKLHLTYNGIEVKKYEKNYKNFKKKLNIDDQNIIITKVANLIPYKGHVDILNACINLKHKNWTLIFVGKIFNETFYNLKDILTKNNISSKVIFLGIREDISKILSITDIGVLTSYEEGFSNAILEYMASSLPIVASNVGGNREAILHGKNGYIVEPKKIEDITKSIEILIRDKNKRIRFGKKSIEFAENKFSIKQMVRQYEMLYIKTYKS